MRRIWVVLILVLWSLLGCSLAVVAAKQPRKARVAPVPPGFVPWPNHTEWSEFTVPSGGYMLCRRPVPADSLGAKSLACIEIPPGTEVYVPRLVPGLTPEEMQQRKWRTAWR